eukprot:5582347-Pyramimonas_sp.AAC.1
MTPRAVSLAWKPSKLVDRIPTPDEYLPTPVSDDGVQGARWALHGWLCADYRVYLGRGLHA